MFEAAFFLRFETSSVRFHTNIEPRRLPLAGAVVLLLVLVLCGCQKEEIRVYTAPKDSPEPVAQVDQAAPEPASPHQQPLRPQVTWKLPQGWREDGANAMSLANFTIPGQPGKEAGVSITQLGNLTGKDALLVNMFRQEFGLPQLTDDEVAKQLHPVEVGTQRGNLFELSGTRKDQTLRIVTVVVHHPDGSWFYRISGDPDVVENQKPAFLAFLKSIQIKEAPAATQEPEVASEKFNWSVPATWKATAPGQMQVARFSVPEKNSGKAEVFASVFPSDTGGNLANINRWRKQLGMEPATEQDLGQLISPLDSSNPQAILVDMSNNNRRLIGAIVPREGKYWFYKLLGDAEAVAPEKESFVAFAKSKP
jgi:hypothetical protein